MREIRSVGPDLSVALTDNNTLALMVETDDGEFLAEVTDIDGLIRKLRELDLIRAERQPLQWSRTTAEVDLERRQEAARATACKYTQSHTRDWCGNPNCREG